MQTKEYLRQITRYDKMIQNKLAEIYQLKTLACSVTISPDTEKVQTSGDKDRTGVLVSKIVDLEREVDTLIDRYAERRKHIIEQIDNLPNLDHYLVLNAKFVRGMDFKEIPDEVKMSKAKMFSVYSEALRSFENRYGSEYLTVE